MNEQIKHELYSAYLYLSMAAYCEMSNLGGIAKWLRMQALEEQEHAMKFFDYINDCGGRVILQGIDQPPSDFKSPIDIFEQVLDHEKKVTSRINLIYRVAAQENDYASQHFLSWFVAEQIEEENNVTQILERLILTGDQGSALFMIDTILGGREE